MTPDGSWLMVAVLGIAATVYIAALFVGAIDRRSRMLADRENAYREGYAHGVTVKAGLQAIVEHDSHPS